MREELRGLGVRATTDVVDEARPQSCVEELKCDQPSEISVWPCGASIDDQATVGGALHLRGNFLADLESARANVRTDRRDEILGRMRHHVDRLTHDARNDASPTGMNSRHVATRGMREEHRNAIGGTRSHCEARSPCNERVALSIGDYRSDVSLTDFTHANAMHLSLFEKSFDRDLESIDEAAAVFSHEFLAVAQVEAQIERIVGR